MGKGNRSSLAWKGCAAAGVLLLAGFLAYSVFQYQKSGIGEKGIITCVGSDCFWSAHIHTQMFFEVCGEPAHLPKFTGALDHLHTHHEEDVIHWHEKLPYDAIGKKFLGPSPFPLERIFGALQISGEDGAIFGKKDGDSCAGGPASWKVFVNGAHAPDWQQYEWSDHDIVHFFFDSRPISEIQADLESQPLQFPELGEG